MDELLPEIALIADAALRDAVRDIWLSCWQESAWERLEDVPKNVDVGQRRLVPHTRSVARFALQAADTMGDVHGIRVDRDVLLAGALLHDVSKLWEYEPGPTASGAVRSTAGELIQHGVYGAFLAWTHALPLALVHLVLSHTHSSRTRPQTQEALIIHYVDYLDSDCLSLEHGLPLLLAR